MMKRLLVLMLVLGLTSVASAALSAVSAVTDGNVTWDVVNDQLVGVGDSAGTYNAEVGPTSGSLTPDASFTPAGLPGAGPNAGNNASLSADTVFAGFYYTYAQATVGSQVLADWFVFDISWVDSGDGKMYVEVYNESNSWSPAVGTVAILLPEPMTIALLGLGGLFLRRRKK